MTDIVKCIRKKNICYFYQKLSQSLKKCNNKNFSKQEPLFDKRAELSTFNTMPLPKGAFDKLLEEASSGNFVARQRCIDAFKAVLSSVEESWAKPAIKKFFFLIQNGSVDGVFRKRPFYSITEKLTNESKPYLKLQMIRYSGPLFFSQSFDDHTKTELIECYSKVLSKKCDKKSEDAAISFLCSVVRDEYLSLELRKTSVKALVKVGFDAEIETSSRKKIEELFNHLLGKEMP